MAESRHLDRPRWRGFSLRGLPDLAALGSRPYRRLSTRDPALAAPEVAARDQTTYRSPTSSSPEEQVQLLLPGDLK